MHKLRLEVFNQGKLKEEQVDIEFADFSKQVLGSNLAMSKFNEKIIQTKGANVEDIVIVQNFIDNQFIASAKIAKNQLRAFISLFYVPYFIMLLNLDQTVNWVCWVCCLMT